MKDRIPPSSNPRFEPRQEKDKTFKPKDMSSGIVELKSDKFRESKDSEKVKENKVERMYIES